jgi:phosphoribosyl-dephospho-CoA transferase
MKNSNYYSRKILHQEIEHLRKLLEQIELKNNLLHKVAVKHGYTAMIDININANNLNCNYYQGRLTGIKLALKLMH